MEIGGWKTLSKNAGSQLRMQKVSLGLFFFRVGLDGNACALRLLCEVVDRPLKKAGLLGDIINLVLRYTWQPVQNVVHDLPTFLQR